MKLNIKAAIAAACALGMTTAFAQSVQRGETTAVKGTQTVAQASTVAPVQVAQAGGSSSGASTGVEAGIPGGVGSVVVFVGAAAVAVLAVGGTTSSSTGH